jgi:hypothetical protein
MPTLNLYLRRYDKGKDHTNGEFYVEDMLFGESLEPPSRGLSKDMPLEEIKKKKVYGKTAIPTGTYELELRVSPSLKNRPYAKKYGGRFPYLKDVPCWSGVMIHPFNYASESKGCIAVGEKYKPGCVIRTTQGLEDLMDFYLLKAFETPGMKVFLTITE